MKKTILLFVSLILTSSAWAGQKVQKMNNEMISIDGQYAERTMTKSERLKALRAKLEKRTEQVVQQKIEQLRFQQELELTKKIQKAFNERMSALDQAFAEEETDVQM